ncbi:hypothetical protein HDU81_010850 [Chytriomyces hyalinus]|nr:hypothetical protein HDU81_010850 [Chytriomyces hyalinus]
MSETQTIRTHLEWTKATLRLAEGASEINSHLLDAVVALDTRIIPVITFLKYQCQRPSTQLLPLIQALSSVPVPMDSQLLLHFVALKLKRDFIRSSQKSHLPDQHLVCVYDSYLRSSMIALRVFHGESPSDMTTSSAPHEYFYAKMNGDMKLNLHNRKCDCNTQHNISDTNILDYLELPLSEDLYVLEEHRLGIAFVFLMDSAKDARMRSFDPKGALEKISILIKSCSLFLNNHSYMMHLLALHIVSPFIRSKILLDLILYVQVSVGCPELGSFLVQSRILHAIQGYLMHLELNSCLYESSEWKHDELILSWLWDRALTSLSWSSPAVRMTRAWMVVGLEADPSKLTNAVSKMLSTPHGAAMLIRVFQESFEQAELPAFQRQNLSHSLTLALQGITSWKAIPDSSIVLLLDFLLRGAIKSCLIECVNIQMLQDSVDLLELLHKTRPQLRVQMDMQENVGLLVNLSMK